MGYIASAVKTVSSNPCVDPSPRIKILGENNENSERESNPKL